MTLKTKINLSIVAFIILTIFIIVFLIPHLFSEIKKSSRELISQKEKLAEFQAMTEDLEKFKSDYPEIKENLEKINILFIDPEVPVDFISFLEKTSNDCKVKLDISLGLPQKIEKDPWPSISLQIRSASSFSNFMRFLEKLEQSSYLIEIQNLSIARLSEMELTQPFPQKELLERLVSGDVKATFSIKVFTK